MNNLRFQGYLRIIKTCVGLGMIAISVYLTQHYFAVHFPTTFSSGSLCNISQFWNCDSAAFSPLGAFLGVPTSLFGVMFGVFVVFGALVSNKNVEKTNFFLALLNFVGCVVLGVYSLLFLGGLCPGCTIYYLLSLILLGIFVKQRGLLIGMPSPTVLSGYGAVAALFLALSFFYNKDRIKAQDVALTKWLSEIEASETIDDLDLDFSTALVKATNNFADAPLRITIFSDFMCPFCKILGKEVEKVAPRYRGKLNVRYMFFPIDSSCNKKLSTRMHPYACSAAALSYCAKERFAAIHDEIYEHQTELSDEWITKASERWGVKECYQDPASMTAVTGLVASTDKYNIDGAPLILVNGKKISGILPAKALIVLLDDLLAKSK